MQKMIDVLSYESNCKSIWQARQVFIQTLTATRGRHDAGLSLCLLGKAPQAPEYIQQAVWQRTVPVLNAG